MEFEKNIFDKTSRSIIKNKIKNELHEKIIDTIYKVRNYEFLVIENEFDNIASYELREHIKNSYSDDDYFKIITYLVNDKVALNNLENILYKLNSVYSNKYIKRGTNFIFGFVNHTCLYKIVDNDVYFSTFSHIRNIKEYIKKDYFNSTIYDEPSKISAYDFYNKNEPQYLTSQLIIDKKDISPKNLEGEDLKRFELFVKNQEVINNLSIYFQKQNPVRIEEVIQFWLKKKNII